CPRRRKSHYEQLTEYERGRVIGLREGGFSFRNISGILGWNVSSKHDCCEQRSSDGTASRRLRSERPCGTTVRKKRRFRRTALAHRNASAEEIRTAVGTTLTRRTVRNRLLQEQFPARCHVARIPLTPSHYRLRRQWCQTTAHWKTEWRSVVFSDESKFCQ
ncbi:transposable element Tc1 transposase, partial [Trichonephila clavipes]